LHPLKATKLSKCISWLLTKTSHCASLWLKVKSLPFPWCSKTQQQGRKNQLPRHQRQVYFHAGLVLIANHMPARASALLRWKLTKCVYAHALSPCYLFFLGKPAWTIELERLFIFKLSDSTVCFVAYTVAHRPIESHLYVYMLSIFCQIHTCMESWLKIENLYMLYVTLQ